MTTITKEQALEALYRVTEPEQWEVVRQFIEQASTAPAPLPSARKTHHCIDWRKTAAEIGDDYARMAMELDAARALLQAAPQSAVQPERLTEQDRNILCVALYRFAHGPGHANDIARAKQLGALLAATQAEPPAQGGGVLDKREEALRFVGASGPLGDPDVMASPGVGTPARSSLCEHECAEGRLEGKPCGAGSCALLDVPPMSDGVKEDGRG